MTQHLAHSNRESDHLKNYESIDPALRRPHRRDETQVILSARKSGRYIRKARNHG
jgi:hypothetical protein